MTVTGYLETDILWLALANKSQMQLIGKYWIGMNLEIHSSEIENVKKKRMEGNQ